MKRYRSQWHTHEYIIPIGRHTKFEEEKLEVYTK